MARGEFIIGEHEWTSANGNASIKYHSAADNHEVKADGVDDARHTFRGRKVRIITITITWKEDRLANGNPGPIDTYATNFMKAISPAGPTAGKSWAWTEMSQGVHNVNNITVDSLEETRVPGVGSASATLTLGSWVKPAARPFVTATPTAPTPWSPTEIGPPRAPPPGFATTPVVVKP